MKFINKLCKKGKHRACHSNGCACDCGHPARAEKLAKNSR